MIKGIHHELFDELKKAPHTFYVTGSRFFGDYTGRSDYDFFTQESDATRLFLQKLELLETTWNPRYTVDPSIISVWTHPKLPIHIQFVNAADLKWKIQNLLKDKGILPVHRDQKHLERKIWQAAWLCLEIDNSLIVSHLLKGFNK